MSSNVMYLYVLGMAASRAGDKELDEKAIHRLIDIGGDTPEFHLILGKSYLQREEIAGALTELGKAEALNPQLPYLHFNLAVAYLHIANYEKSEAEFPQGYSTGAELADNLRPAWAPLLAHARMMTAWRNFARRSRRIQKAATPGLVLQEVTSDKRNMPRHCKRSIKRQSWRRKNQRVHFIRGQVLQRWPQG